MLLKLLKLILQIFRHSSFLVDLLLIILRRLNHSAVLFIIHAKHYLIFAQYRGTLSIFLFILTLIFLQHVIYLIHILISDIILLLISLSLESANSHSPLGHGHILIHLQFDPIDIKLLCITLYFLALISYSVGSF